MVVTLATCRSVYAKYWTTHEDSSTIHIRLLNFAENQFCLFGIKAILRFERVGFKMPVQVPKMEILGI